MEGLQLKHALVNPLAALAGKQLGLELGIKREEVQVHHLAVDLLHIVHHILDEDIVGRAGTVNPDLGIHIVHLHLVLLLGVGIDFLVLLHPVDGVMVGLVLGHDRTEDHFNERTDTTLTGRWIGYDKHLIVQSALLLRLVIVVVMATGGQRAIEAGTAEEDGRIGRHIEFVRQFLHAGIILEERLEAFPVSAVLLIDGLLAHLVRIRLVDRLGVLLQHLLENLGHIGGVLVGQGVLHIPFHIVTLFNQILDELLFQQIVPHGLGIVLHDVAHIPGEAHHLVVTLTVLDAHLFHPVVDEDIDTDAFIADLLERLVYFQRFLLLHLGDTVPDPAVYVVIDRLSLMISAAPSSPVSKKIKISRTIAVATIPFIDERLILIRYYLGIN